MKILIIRFGAIGDLVMASLLIRCLKGSIEGAKLHLLTGKLYKHVLSANPYLHAIHELGERQLQVLKETGFDHILDLENTEQSRAASSFIGTNTAKVKKYSLREQIFTRLKWNLMPRKHLAERFLETSAFLGVQNDGKGLDYFIPESAHVSQHDIPTSHLLGYVAIVIGASKWNKRMPQEKLSELCKSIDHPIILMGGKEEFATAEGVRSIDNIRIYNACGKFSLHESADLLRKAKLVVSHDTGLMHIAAAFGRPVIAVWGSTTPSLGMGPYYGGNMVALHAQVHKLWCRPCSTHGLNHCPQGHFKCMKKMDIGDIAVKVESILRRK